MASHNIHVSFFVDLLPENDQNM